MVFVTPINVFKRVVSFFGHLKFINTYRKKIPTPETKIWPKKPNEYEIGDIIEVSIVDHLVVIWVFKKILKKSLCRETLFWKLCCSHLNLAKSWQNIAAEFSKLEDFFTIVLNVI